MKDLNLDQLVSDALTISNKACDGLAGLDPTQTFLAILQYQVSNHFLAQSPLSDRDDDDLSAADGTFNIN